MSYNQIPPKQPHYHSSRKDRYERRDDYQQSRRYPNHMNHSSHYNHNHNNYNNNNNFNNNMNQPINYDMNYEMNQPMNYQMNYEMNPIPPMQQIPNIPSMNSMNQMQSNQFEEPQNPTPTKYQNAKSIYVCGIDEHVDEQLLLRIFTIIGTVVSVKIIKDSKGISSGYGFIEFSNHETAQFAKDNMDGKLLYGKELKINWTNIPQTDTNSNYKIFIGGLQTSVSDNLLFNIFSKYGHINDARVIKVAQTGKSKGYGFVSFSRKEDAETAIQMMNGEKIEGRNVKVNWVLNQSSNEQNEIREILTYEDVDKLSTPTNTNVFIGNVNKMTTKEELKNIMSVHGEVVDIRWKQGNNYGFVRFKTHEQAVHAIVECNGFMIRETPIKCSWGKE